MQPTRFATQLLALAGASAVCSAAPPQMPRPNTTVVFAHGEAGYPCIRIPSIISVGDSASGISLLAFAECRYVTGDGCNPLGAHTALPSSSSNASRDICSKHSSDNGASWSALKVVVHDAAQPQAVYDNIRRQVVLNYNVHGGPTRLDNPNWATVSKDFGKTWEPAVQVDSNWPTGAQGSAAGPGIGIQLRPSNPHAPGRLLFIGHRGWNHRSKHAAELSAGRSLCRGLRMVQRRWWGYICSFEL